MPATATCITYAVHLADTTPNPVYLEWALYDGSRYRTDHATCLTCHPTVIYEWGNLGGTWRIRRTNLQTGATHITPWATVKTAATWWKALQDGTAI